MVARDYISSKHYYSHCDQLLSRSLNIGTLDYTYNALHDQAIKPAGVIAMTCKI